MDQRGLCRRERLRDHLGERLRPGGEPAGEHARLEGEPRPGSSPPTRGRSRRRRAGRPGGPRCAPPRGAAARRPRAPGGRARDRASPRGSCRPPPPAGCRPGATSTSGRVARIEAHEQDPGLPGGRVVLLGERVGVHLAHEHGDQARGVRFLQRPGAPHHGVAAAPAAPPGCGGAGLVPGPHAADEDDLAEARSEARARRAAARPRSSRVTTRGDDPSPYIDAPVFRGAGGDHRGADAQRRCRARAAPSRAAVRTIAVNSPR